MGRCFVNPEWVARALADFEAVADEGVYTLRHHIEASWGFYPSYGTPAEPSHSDLLMMDPFLAYTRTKSLCKRRITTTTLCHPEHPNAAVFRSNRPEQKDLRRRQ